MDAMTHGLPYRHVACYVDGSEPSWCALAHAHALCDASGARLSVLYADRWAGLAASAQVWVPDLADLRALLERWLRDELRRRDLDEAVAVVLEDRSPRTVCTWVHAARPDLIVIADPGGSRLRRLLGGSIAAYLSRHAPCPVALQVSPSPRGRPPARARTTALHGPRR